MATKKLTWLLILQAWTMLWVVIGHSSLPEPTSGSNFDSAVHSGAMALFYFAYSFHMPLFIMISGYLFYNTRIARGWSYGKMAFEKFLRLGVPYIIFISIAIIIKLCLPGDVNRTVDTSGTGLIMNYLSPFDGALQEMWFIAVILLYFLIYPLYRYILKSKVTIAISLLVTLGFYYIPVSSVTDILAINRAIHYSIFFLLGLIIARMKFELILGQWKIVLICGLLYVISWIFHLGPLTAIFSSISFWGLAIIIDRSLSDNIFHTFRNYTYQIFLIGIFFQIGIKAFYNRIGIDNTYIIGWLLCVLAGVYLPVLVAKITEKSGNKYLKMTLGLK